jgi:hypothetical protein
MEYHLFYAQSPLVVLIAMSIILMATALLGFWIGRVTRQRVVDKSVVGVIQASVLGLLALMLGFTFQAASARYDTRRALAIDEANALKTTFLRAQTLREPYRTNISNMLRDYVDLRLQMVSASNNTNKAKLVKLETEELQQAMWKQATGIAIEDPSDITGLFLESLNDSIDLYSARIEWFRSRVPDTILWILAFISCSALGIVGYGFGIAGQKSWLIMALVSILIAAVIVMIVDLDRPLTGPTRVSQQSMLDLRDSLSGFEQKSR